MRSSLRDHFSSENLLLPVAYPEGAPAHPSYPAGHAAVAGACATVLKAFFREDVEFQAPVRPADDGLTVIPYEGPRLHVGNELNKLASNIALGRDFAGIHFRSDCSAGLSLGERIACAYLADVRRCLTEKFDGFTLTTFSGDTVSI
jgi:PAP2 superfamily protein